MADQELTADIMEEKGAAILSKIVGILTDAGFLQASAVAALIAAANLVSTSTLAATLADYTPTEEVNASLATLATQAAVDSLAATVAAIPGADATQRYAAHPGINNNAIPNLNTVVAAAQDGDTIILKAGQSFRASSRWTINPNGRTLRILGYGSEVVFDNFQDGLTIKNPWVRQSFTTMAADGLSITGVANIAQFRDKDFVTLTSSQVDDESAHAPNSCQAEELFVESIDIATSTIRFMRPSGVKSGERLPYTTNQKVCQRPLGQVVIEGLKIRHKSDAPDSAWVGNGIFELWGLSFPVIKNMQFPYALGPTWVNGCLGARITGCVFGTRPDTKYTSPEGVADFHTYGYGVCDGSTGTLIDGCLFYRNRHAVTTSDKAYGSGATDPAQYGGSFGLTVSNCIAFAPTDDGFGTHHRSRGATFNNCGVIDGNAYAFQIRSQGTLNGCWDRNCFGTWHTFDEVVGRVPSRTWARISNYTSTRSGAANNSCRGVPVYVENYHWYDGQRHNPGFLAQGFADTTTVFSGRCVIQPGNVLQSNNALIGPNTKGRIEFETIDFDVTKVQTNLGGYGIDCRGNNSATNNFQLVGRLIRVTGTYLGAFFNATNTNYADPGQMKFSICFRPNVVQFTGSAQTNANYIQYVKNNDWAAITGVNLINWDDQYSGFMERSETLTLDFGTVNAYPAMATRTVPLYPYRSVDLVKWRVACAYPGVEIVKVWFATDNNLSVTMRNLNAVSTAFAAVPVGVGLSR